MAEKEVKVPDIGNFKDVEVIEVMVKPGDTVAKEQGLITLETDKAAMDVPSPYAGTIKALKVKKGDKVSEGSLVLIIDAQEEAAKPAAAPQKAAAPAASGPVAPKPFAAAPVGQVAAAPASLPPINESGFSKAHAGPSVRKFARELGVDLSRVSGRGRKGRITQEDVKAFVKAVMQGGLATGGGLPKVPEVDFARFGEVEVKPLSRIKRISGPRLQAAWINVPHVTQHDEADITGLEQLRQELKSDAEKIGAKLTPLAFLVKASVTALKQYPDFNSSLDPSGQNQVMKHYFHIGFAADTPNGLVVPVIKNADKKNVFEVAKELGDLATKARDGKLKADEMQGGCFSISRDRKSVV